MIVGNRASPRQRMERRSSLDSLKSSASWARSLLPSRGHADEVTPTPGRRRSAPAAPIQEAQDDEPGVRQALVPASLFTSLLGEHALISVDARPLVIHCLHGLEWSGITRAVVVLGKGAEELASAVRLERFEKLKVELLWGDDFGWGTSLANSIMAARGAFDEKGEPLLIVRSDYLFDWRLLHKMARARFTSKDIDAFALVDTAQEVLEWISGAHCGAHCKNGHCHALVKVLLGHGDRIARIGHRLAAYDALQAGIYVARPIIFKELAGLLRSEKFCTVADSMQALATNGRLRFREVEDLLWFGHETMETALTEHTLNSVAVDSTGRSASTSAWRAQALQLLFSAWDRQ